MQNGVLDRVNSITWKRTSSGGWEGFQGLAAFAEHVYVVARSESNLFQIEPASWKYVRDSTNWIATEGMTPWRGYLYIMHGGCFHKVDPQTLTNEALGC
jgi:hypothetical protein